MRCAIYCRVSTDDQNLDRQVDELREFAARMKWELDGEYSDKLSGAQRSRPGLDAMMEAAERREFDVLTVWALDRVGRSTLHTLEIVEKLDALSEETKALEAIYERKQAALTELKQSLLQKAFAGEL